MIRRRIISHIMRNNTPETWEAKLIGRDLSTRRLITDTYK